MKVIKINDTQLFATFPPLVMALGFFDGVHRGHQEVILNAVKTAEDLGMNSAVMTFDPHPSIVLQKDKSTVHYITPIEDKIELIAKLNVDYLLIVQFTEEFSKLLPEEFVKKYLIENNVKHVVAGFDFTYGKFGKGNMNNIEEFAKDAFSITVVSKLEEENEKISSTAIRKLIHEGKLLDAQSLLGRFYTMSGTVVHGEKRGRTIGFPTANVQVSKDYVLPKIGVYAVRLFVRGQWRQGVCNLGIKPTFHDSQDSAISMEVYLFDFDEEIYGETVSVEYHRRIRDEMKFAGIHELISQINNDVKIVKNYFLG